MLARELVPALAFVLVSIGCTPQPSAELEANKELVRQFGEVVNASNWEALGAIMADDFKRHSAATAGPPVTSRDEFIQLQKSFLVGFPDQRVTVQRVVAEGDLVATLATYHATHTGPMGDVPATGRVIETPFLTIFRIESGMIAELWVEWDNVAMLEQLGLYPPGPATD